MPTEIAELLSSLLQVIRLRSSAPPPAFVYQRYSLNNLTGLFLARRWRRPLILEANASEVKWRQDWSALRFPGLARACERLLLSGASRIAVVSENAAADLVAMGADPERLVVVPNAADFERFAGAPAMPLPFPPDAVVVAFVGLFYPWHGVRYLAHAFVALADAFPAARLLLVGDGEDAAHVRSILGAAGLSERLHMPGLVARADVPRYLAAAEILVSPHAPIDRFIGSPVKIFEYMAAGRAIVASRVAQIGEILTDRETALLVPAGDENALALAMLELCRDAPLRARLAEHAQAEARTSHSWDARVATILGSGG
jgi:glycosyltransferase involved in cell wall biosynthesis